MANATITRSFLETLHPLLSKVNAERKLSPGKLGVLRHLAEQGRATASELAVVVRVSPQAISLATRELERLKIVVRVPDSADRRRIWIELTELGRHELTRELAAGREWLERSIEERLTSDEREALENVVPVLRKLGRDGAVD
jgi:DNA-binding MarR family transcriptional regulator